MTSLLYILSYYNDDDIYIYNDDIVFTHIVISVNNNMSDSLENYDQTRRKIQNSPFVSPKGSPKRSINPSPFVLQPVSLI